MFPPRVRFPKILFLCAKTPHTYPTIFVKVLGINTYHTRFPFHNRKSRYEWL